MDHRKEGTTSEKTVWTTEQKGQHKRRQFGTQKRRNNIREDSMDHGTEGTT